MKVIKSLALFVLLVALLLAAPLLFLSENDTPPPAQDMPWQIEALPDGGSRVFGLEPGRSRYGEAREKLGAGQVALIVAPNESGALEAYYESFAAGPLTGKLVLSLASTLAEREAVLQRARKVEYMDSATKRVNPSNQDLAAAEGALITAIVFIPSANLDEAIILQRFGLPAERIRSDEHREHFLYPDKGLDLQLDAKGKEVLQYVAPRDFARLREPLAAKN